ncbi:Uncharacterised protein [uncultured archaeon]|nr:Uncharacterised protein [uncultured archaeon]
MDRICNYSGKEKSGKLVIYLVDTNTLKNHRERENTEKK